MFSLKSIRESLRDEYEQKVEQEQGKNKMKVVDFQLQVQNWPTHTTDILWKIDPQAPIPAALEGGDGKGVLILCVLDANRIDALETYCKEHPNLRIYTSYHRFELEESLYSSKNYVCWGFGKNPTVKTSPY